jgi:hypothetical protein
MQSGAMSMSKSPFQFGELTDAEIRQAGMASLIQVAVGRRGYPRPEREKKEQQMTNSVNHMGAVRRISQSLCIVLSLLTCAVLSAQNQAHRVRNIVLVHGSALLVLA